MGRRRRDDDDDDYEYDETAPSRPTYSLGGSVGIGALAGLVGGEAVLILAGLSFLKNAMGPGAVFVAWGLCFLVFALSPAMVLLGICGGAATAKTRSLVLGCVIGALSGPALVFILWGCGAISITVNNQPVKFTLNMALWWSAIMWVPGAIGALFAGLICKLDPNRGYDDRPRRGRRRRSEEDDSDDEDNRGRRRDRDDRDDREDDRPRRRR